MLGLRTVIYKVGDLKKAKDWYAAAFDTAPYFDEDFYVGFDIGGYELGLQPEEESPDNKAESVLAYWGTNNLQLIFDRLLALGATEHESPTDVGSGIQVASLKDPWDNIIGIIYNPHFKVK
ncbi:MAG TPA: VOC family protein [Saprospiraceae bacterium]|nr:VOC family protein [Saprospiraceae bacterium]HMQ85365.1 VOC family protein [Saprospiraceae bacterium]